MSTDILNADLDRIALTCAPIWDALRGAHILLTGGSGFFGRWLVESFVRANDSLGLGARLTVVSRRPEALTADAPHLAAASVLLRAHDVRTLPPGFGQFDYILHAATSSTTPSAPLETVDTVIGGTRAVLDLAVACKARGVLVTSSGAVYGPLAPLHVAETDNSGPDCASPRSAYAESKRTAELLCGIYAAERGVPVKIARCFAFVGPFLPLDVHFAIGNFVRDALAGGPIRIGGDGTPVRSYMYGADLAAWLWSMLVSGEAGRAYNVGSPHPVSIADLAHRVAAQIEPAPQVLVAGTPVPGQRPHTYVPSIERAEKELGLRIAVGLDEAIARTIAWHRR